MAAMDELGLGPCYHMKVMGMKKDPNEINMWYNLGQGQHMIYRIFQNLILPLP